MLFCFREETTAADTDVPDSIHEQLELDKEYKQSEESIHEFNMEQKAENEIL